jgi:hypothetical protein
MPRKHRHRTMKGGFWDSLTQGVSDAWEKTKKASSDAYSSATGSTTGSTSSYVPPPPPPTPTTSSSSGYMGGRMRGRKRSRKMRGGYGDNIALTGLASSSAPISDIKSAQPLTTVGGRRTKRRHGGKHRHGKSCKTRRH